MEGRAGTSLCRLRLKKMWELGEEADDKFAVLHEWNAEGHCDGTEKLNLNVNLRTVERAL